MSKYKYNAAGYAMVFQPIPVLMTKHRNRLTDAGNRRVEAKGEGGGGMDWGFGVSRCKRLHLEWRSHAVLPHSAQGTISNLLG